VNGCKCQCSNACLAFTPTSLQVHLLLAASAGRCEARHDLRKRFLHRLFSSTQSSAWAVKRTAVEAEPATGEVDAAAAGAPKPAPVEPKPRVPDSEPKPPPVHMEPATNGVGVLDASAVSDAAEDAAASWCFCPNGFCTNADVDGTANEAAAGAAAAAAAAVVAVVAAGDALEAAALAGEGEAALVGEGSVALVGEGSAALGGEGSVALGGEGSAALAEEAAGEPLVGAGVAVGAVRETAAKGLAAAAGFAAGAVKLTPPKGLGAGGVSAAPPRAGRLALSIRRVASTAAGGGFHSPCSSPSPCGGDHSVPGGVERSLLEGSKGLIAQDAQGSRGGDPRLKPWLNAAQSLARRECSRRVPHRPLYSQRMIHAGVQGRRSKARIRWQSVVERVAVAGWESTSTLLTHGRIHCVSTASVWEARASVHCDADTAREAHLIVPVVTVCDLPRRTPFGGRLTSRR
jgi:hypothetical protein